MSCPAVKVFKVISTGGTLRDSSLSLVGKMAQDVLEKYYVDKAILSCKGIDHRTKGLRIPMRWKQM